MPDQSFKYEVAFSFLAEDEPIAIALGDKLMDRFTTFIYSKQQERLAGTDGEVAFGEVFGAEARIVVVLFRTGWGATSWTRVEETAIRNRAFRAGYDFTLFVQLVAGEEMPVWLPRATIWMGFERWGLDATAAVIERRITEAGGTPAVEGPVAKAARLQRERDFARRREAFLNSQHGINEARNHVALCIQAVEQLTQQMRTIEPPLEVRVSKGRDGIAAFTERVSVSVCFQAQYANTLQGAGLAVKLWSGAIRLDGFPSDATELRAWNFDFDMLASEVLVWRELNGDKRTLSSSALADFAIGTLLDQVDDNRRKGKRSFL